jgi:hypothetical protein
MNASAVLNILDNYNVNEFWSFFSLNHPYSYTIDSRLNIFTGIHDEWAIVCEVLGYNPRAGGITLELTYLGNCLINLPLANNKSSNNRSFIPIDWDQFQETIDGEVLKPGAAFWLVRGVKVPLSHNKKDYSDMGIELKELEKPNEISIEEAGRLIILKYGDLFRATNEELYQSLPDNVKKILVLDEWHHQEYYLRLSMFEDPAFLSLFEKSEETMKEQIRKQRAQTIQYNQDEWDKNRPSLYETWQQIADVILTGDASHYNPSLKPNSHWTNWPESGTL